MAVGPKQVLRSLLFFNFQTIWTISSIFLNLTLGTDLRKNGDWGDRFCVGGKAASEISGF